MLHVRKLFLLVIVALALLSVTAPAALAQDPDQGKVAWEEQAFCRRCHGDAGQGLWAGPLAGSEKTAQEWIEQVRMPRKNMPTFSSEQVSDETIINMHAYISSLPKVEDFTPQDAGLPADAPRGQQLIVEKRCVACHTTTGPIKGFIERGEAPTVERVIKQLRTPFKNMPTFNETKVSDDEAAQIAEFLVSEFNAAQSAPATLPQSGGVAVSMNLFVPTLLLLGAGLLLAGLVLRRLLTHS